MINSFLGEPPVPFARGSEQSRWVCEWVRQPWRTETMSSSPQALFCFDYQHKIWRILAFQKVTTSKYLAFFFFARYMTHERSVIFLSISYSIAHIGSCSDGFSCRVDIFISHHAAPLVNSNFVKQVILSVWFIKVWLTEPYSQYRLINKRYVNAEPSGFDFDCAPLPSSYDLLLAPLPSLDYCVVPHPHFKVMAPRLHGLVSQLTQCHWL